MAQRYTPVGRTTLAGGHVESPLSAPAAPPPVDLIRVEDREVRATGTFDQIYSSIHPNGELHHWRLVKFIIPQAAGPPLIGSISLDITDRIQAQSALDSAYDATLEGWVHALDLRDNETEGHSRRVTELTVAVARHAGFSDDDLEHIRRGALLHDIGKMAVPDHIMQKPGPLTPDEWDIMKRHPVYAYDWLRDIDYLIPALDIPHYHHERMDGTGYPAGLAGDGIPLPARIFAIVDVWDALTSDRPYRKAWSVEKTTAYLREQAGSHFDPNLVDLFLRLLDEGQLPHAIPPAS